MAAWEPREGKKYTAFLSHYKAECASTARYLHDLLQKMLGCDNFLDSSNLPDLRTLFDVGLRTSDTLVLLASKNVLTRPWCLLELWTATQTEIPVVVLDVHAGFDREDARHLLTHLDTELEARNPGALKEVSGHLAARGATLAQLSAALLVALELSEPNGVEARMLHWDPGSSDLLLLGATKDLAECLAQVTARTLDWHDPLDETATDDLVAHFEDSIKVLGTPRAEHKVGFSEPAQPEQRHSQQHDASRAGPSSQHCAAGSLQSAKHHARGSRSRLLRFVQSLSLPRWRGLDRVAEEHSQVEDPMAGVYGLFISYAREEACAHARFLHSLFERELKRPVFLENTVPDLDGTQ